MSPRKRTWLRKGGVSIYGFLFFMDRIREGKGKEPPDGGKQYVPSSFFDNGGPGFEVGFARAVLKVEPGEPVDEFLDVGFLCGVFHQVLCDDAGEAGGAFVELEVDEFCGEEVTL